MKIIFKSFCIIVLLTVFLIAACGGDSDDDNYSNKGPTNIIGPLEVKDQQVWEENKNVTKMSEAYNKFSNKGELAVSAFFIVPKTSGPEIVKMGSGNIKNGRLSFNIPAPEDDSSLMDWATLKMGFFREWYLMDEELKANDPPVHTVTVSDETVKGNYVAFATEDLGMLIREGLYSTELSIGMDYIWYVYVDRACVVTLSGGEGVWPGNYYFNANACTLNLDKGWNTVCRTQAYGRSGRADISIEKKNPNDLKWVIFPGEWQYPFN